MKYSVFSGVLPELSPEEVCAALARHGYDGVEWRVDGEYHFAAAEIDRAAARIKALCADHGLEPVSLTSYVRLDDSDGIKRFTDACATIGCPRFRAFGAHYDASIGFWAQRDELRRRLEDAERVLAGTGVKALLEIHFGTLLPSPALAFELFRERDPACLGVILDPANMVIEGSMDLRMGLDMIGPYVDLVHVKNTRWERREDGTWRWRFDDLEDGQCNWPETMAALAETGYHGYLSFENLYRVPVRHKGYVAEDLTDWEGGPRDIDQRLAGELAYIRGLVEDA